MQDRHPPANHRQYDDRTAAEADVRDRDVGVSLVAPEGWPVDSHLAEALGLVEIGTRAVVDRAGTGVVLTEHLEHLVCQVHRSCPAAPTGFGN